MFVTVSVFIFHFVLAAGGMPLSVSVSCFAAWMMVSAGMNPGCMMYSCLDLTISDSLIPLVAAPLCSVVLNARTFSIVPPNALRTNYEGTTLLVPPHLPPLHHHCRPLLPPLPPPSLPPPSLLPLLLVLPAPPCPHRHHSRRRTRSAHCTLPGVPVLPRPHCTAFQPGGYGPSWQKRAVSRRCCCQPRPRKHTRPTVGKPKSKRNPKIKQIGVVRSIKGAGISTKVFTSTEGGEASVGCAGSYPGYGGGRPGCAGRRPGHADQNPGSRVSQTVQECKRN
jgi:hypothetical protein